MPHLVSIPKGAIMSCRLARIRLRIGVSIPKGAIMSFPLVPQPVCVHFVSIPKGAIMSREIHSRHNSLSRFNSKRCDYEPSRSDRPSSL